MAALAQATSLRARPPVPDVYVLGHRVRLQAPLCLHRRKQRIGNVLPDDAARAANNAGARLDVRARDYTAVVNHVILSTSCEIKVDIVVIILVRIFELALHVGFVLYNPMKRIRGTNVNKAIASAVVLRVRADHVLLTRVHFPCLRRQRRAASMNYIRRVLLRLVRFDVIDIILHVVIILTPSRRLNSSMMTRVTVRVLVREVEVRSILRRPVVCCRASLPIPLIEQLGRQDALVVAEDLPRRLLVLVGGAGRAATPLLSAVARVLLPDVLRVLRAQVVEPVVLDGLAGRDALVRVHLEH